MIKGNRHFFSRLGRIVFFILWMPKFTSVTGSIKDTTLLANINTFEPETTLQQEDSCVSSTGSAFHYIHPDHQLLSLNSRIKLPSWIRYMVSDTVSSSKPRFLFYPTIGYSPETRWEFGMS